MFRATNESELSALATPYRLHYHVPSATSRITNGGRRMVREQVADLISFLAVTHSMSINLVFITWELSLGMLGDGATAKVWQLELNLKRSLAFKRPQVAKLAKNASKEDRASLDGEYRILISEILTLCSEGLRFHPNIINLEAICWDFQKDTDDVWPVLVFEKADEGDLRTFLNSPRGRTLDLRKRLQLCQDVAIAMLCLHRYGIIHGDINPRNLLVFREKEDVYIKMSDFGYAALMHRDDHIDMAKTWPWYAPECQHQWSFDFEDARKTDFYSFGAVCLWILFNRCFQDEGHLTKVFNQLTYPWIEDLRRSRTIQRRAVTLVDGIPDLEPDELQALKEFFENSLTENPEDRSLSLKGLFYEHSTRTDIGKVTFDSIQPHFFTPQELPYAGQFKLSKVWRQTMLGDFRFWIAIFQALEVQAKSHPDEQCRKNAALQLALCFELGFGCTRSRSDSLHWLSRGSGSEEYLEQEVKSIDSDDITPTVLGGGWSPTVAPRHHNPGHTYKTARLLEQAEKMHRKAIGDLQHVLRSSHSMILEQKLTVADIKLTQGKVTEAYDIVSEVLTICRTSLVSCVEYPRTLCRALSYMTPLCNALRRWTEMKGLLLEYREIVRKTEYPRWVKDVDSYRPRSSNDIRILKQLAQCFYYEQNYEEAEKMLLEYVDEAAERWGQQSAAYIEGRADLGRIYSVSKRSLGPQWLRREINACEAANSFDYTHILGLKISLSNALYRSGCTRREMNEATALGVQNLNDCRLLLGTQHETTLFATEILADIYFRQGRTSEARALRETNLALCQVRSGEEQPVTAWSQWVLARSLMWDLHWDEALALRVRSVRTLTEALGENHPDVRLLRELLSTSQKSRTFWAQLDRVIPERIFFAMARRINAIQAWRERRFYLS